MMVHNKGIQRAQLTLQELQDLKDRQRQQILYNSQEIAEKQQQLMKMHKDLRTRYKIQNGPQRSASSSSEKPAKPKNTTDPPTRASSVSSLPPAAPSSPRADPKVAKPAEREQYARMLRQTYHNMGKMQQRNSLQQELNLKKFTNTELGHELTKVRSIFKSKQNELAEAVKKVDVLTHQLEQRRNSVSGGAPRTTPERINRRKKIQAAKDELDRLRNELIVRNEMNSQQSHQLKLQRDIIQEKKAELRKLNTKMSELSDALRKQNGYDKNKSSKQMLFENTYLQDTLNRKKPPPPPPIMARDINANNIEQSEVRKKPSPPPSILLDNKKPPPPPPVRTTPVVVTPPPPSQGAIKNNAEFLAMLRQEQNKIDTLKNKLESPDNYVDLQLSSDSDKISEKFKPTFGDADESVSTDLLVNPKPPVVAPKPNVQKNTETSQNSGNQVNNVETKNNNKKYENLEQEECEKLYIVKPLPEQRSEKVQIEIEEGGPSEPNDFELSFADIDELTQNDALSGSSVTPSSYDSESDVESIPVPVVISVPPERMPPPILMKPDKPRKPKRKLVLDPFALLLDSALEGELETVVETLNQVPDPSRANPEGITALHNAVCGNHKDVVRFLVEVACDINAADNNGWTPLHCAAFYNDTELCRFLVEHGASVFATTYTDHQTPAHKCSRLDENYDECFSYLHECKEHVGRIEGGTVHALYDYTPESDDELQFHGGDVINVLKRGDNLEKEWWWSRDRNGNQGYVPCNLIGNFPRIAAEV